jgi:hypothetical protein
VKHNISGGRGREKQRKRIAEQYASKIDRMAVKEEEGTEQ